MSFCFTAFFLLPRDEVRACCLCFYAARVKVVPYYDNASARCFDYAQHDRK